MKKLFKFLFLLFLLSMSSRVFAASLSLSLDNNQVKTGDIINATLLLDTQGQSINTIGGDLNYDPALVRAEVINIGTSSVSLWVEKPDIGTQNQTPGDIHFSGIIPGGISASQVTVFSVIFRALKMGDAHFSLSGLNLFLNDGQGTAVISTSTNASLQIVQGATNTFSSITVYDKTPPEKFSVTRTRDASIYDNKYFLVFSTLDKDSGVDHYQICEYFSCVTGASPFLLLSQNPFYYIIVQAYDFNGNVRNAYLISPWLLLIVVLVVSYLLFIYLPWIFSFFRGIIKRT